MPRWRKSKSKSKTSKCSCCQRTKLTAEKRKPMLCECYFLSQITIGTLSQVELDDHVKIVWKSVSRSREDWMNKISQRFTTDELLEQNSFRKWWLVPKDEKTWGGISEISNNFVLYILSIFIPPKSHAIDLHFPFQTCYFSHFWCSGIVKKNY